MGGQPYDIRQAPWTLFVDIVGVGGCSGSIIDSLHVVTAAHCMFDDSGNATSADKMFVRAGVSNAQTPLPTDAQQDKDVASYRVHPSYVVSMNGPDDVAVLTLASPLDLNGTTAAAISLPQESRPPVGAEAALAGFGKTNASEPSDFSLNGLSLSLLDPLQCPSRLDPGEAVYLCASSPAATPCFGDSGGGLFLPSQPPVLVGVVSFGRGAGCVAGQTAWYANVTAPEVLQFIRGAETPPAAPRLVRSPTFAWKTLRVGTSVGCSAGSWTGTPSYTLTVTTATGTIVHTSRHSPTSYGLRKTDIGHRLNCRVSATNAGGTGFAISAQTSPPVRPARPHK